MNEQLAFINNRILIFELRDSCGYERNNCIDKLYNASWFRIKLTQSLFLWLINHQEMLTPVPWTNHSPPSNLCCVLCCHRALAITVNDANVAVVYECVSVTFLTLSSAFQSCLLWNISRNIDSFFWRCRGMDPLWTISCLVPWFHAWLMGRFWFSSYILIMWIGTRWVGVGIGTGGGRDRSGG